MHSLFGLDCSSVIGEVQLGELLCDSLVEAEDAPLLRFAISANEVSTYIKVFQGFVGR